MEFKGYLKIGSGPLQLIEVIGCEPSHCIIICSGIYYYGLKTQHVMSTIRVLSNCWYYMLCF
jgi:hypothetical protein